MDLKIQNKELKTAFKKVISVFMVAIIYISSFFGVLAMSFTASATERVLIAWGDCGTDGEVILWQLYDDGHLTFDGTGEMCGEFSASILGDYAEDVFSVEFSEGITDVAYAAFDGCEKLQRVIIPESVRAIADTAFNGCSMLTDLSYAGSEGDWTDISIGSEGNDCLLKAELRYNCCTKHQTVSVSEKLSATCVNDGYTEGTYCEDCGCRLMGHYRISATGHSDEDADRICDKCTEKLPCEHSYEEAVTPPACTKQGYTTYTCSECGDSYKSDFTGAAGHTMTYHKAEPSTCTQNGTVEYRLCSVCNRYFADEEGITELETILDEKDGHKAQEDYTVIKKATCKGEGYKAILCSECSEELETETIALAEHSYKIAVTPPKCTKQGYTTYTCTACGYGYTGDFVKLTGHTETATEAVAATCTTAGKTAGKKCTVCGTVTVAQTVISAKGHKSDTGVVTKEPTTEKEGVKTYSCTVCKTALKTERIEKREAAKASNVKTTCVKVKWQAVAGAEKYILYYSTNAKKWTEAATVKKTSYTFKKLKPGTKYYFKIVPVIDGKKSDESEILVQATKPTKVIFSTLKSTKKKQAAAKWKKVTGATGYEVTYSLSKKFTKKTTKTVTIKKAKTKKTTLKKLKSGKKYYVKVRAYKTVNGKKIYGAYSAVKTVKVK